MSLRPRGGEGAGEGVKRRRVDDEVGAGEAEAEATPEESSTSIMDLPEDMKLEILRKLPLKLAKLMAVVSRAWQNLWKELLGKPPYAVEERVLPRVDVGQKVLVATMESLSKAGHRLDRFSLTVECSTMNSERFQRCLQSAAACRVNDLHVELGDKASPKILFHFPKSSPDLARLSLRGIGISRAYYRRAKPFVYLETISLHSIDCINGGGGQLNRMVELSPILRVLRLRHCRRIGNLDLCLSKCRTLRELDLRNCGGIDSISLIMDGRGPSPPPPKLMKVIIVECGRIDEVDFRTISSLHSFCYRGDFVPSFYLPAQASLHDLYICYNAQIPDRLSNEFLINCLANFSQIRILTICSHALQAVSPFSDPQELQLVSLYEFQGLRELQLLMFQMEAVNLGNICVFLQDCRFPNLEKLFVQLPTIENVPLVSSVCKVMELQEIGLDHLKEVKILNFNWSRIEVQLVSFLLRKARPQHKLLLVTPNIKRPLDVPGVDEADLKALRDAVDDGRMVIKESDKDEIQPYHSELFDKL